MPQNHDTTPSQLLPHLFSVHPIIILLCNTRWYRNLCQAILVVSISLHCDFPDSFKYFSNLYQPYMYQTVAMIHLCHICFHIALTITVLCHCTNLDVLFVLVFNYCSIPDANTLVVRNTQSLHLASYHIRS